MQGMNSRCERVGICGIFPCFLLRVASPPGSLCVSQGKAPNGAAGNVPKLWQDLVPLGDFQGGPEHPSAGIPWCSVGFRAGRELITQDGPEQSWGDLGGIKLNFPALALSWVAPAGFGGAVTSMWWWQLCCDGQEGLWDLGVPGWGRGRWFLGPVAFGAV